VHVLQYVMISLLFGLGLGAIMIAIMFFKKKRENKKDKEKYVPTTQDQFPIDYIRGGLLKLKNGGYRIVIEIPSINIDLMETSEKDGILQQYRGVLQALDFPFQYLQQSRIVDISEYLTTLEGLKTSARNNFTKNQLEFYSTFLIDLIKDRSILTKKFYLVIPFDEEKEKNKTKNYSSLSKKKTKSKKGKAGEGDENQEAYDEEQNFIQARKQLVSRANQAEVAFRRFDIGLKILNDNELLELFYTSYNKDKAVYQPLRDIDPKDYTSLRVEATRKGGN